MQVQCDRSWCQLPNGGWVSKSLLSLNGGRGVPVTLPQTMPHQPQRMAAAHDFNGTWRATDPLLQFDLIIAQNGQTLSGLGTLGGTGPVTGQMKSPAR